MGGPKIGGGGGSLLGGRDKTDYSLMRSKVYIIHGKYRFLFGYHKASASGLRSIKFEVIQSL